MTVPQLSEHSGPADWKISPSPPSTLTILLPLLSLSLKIPFNFFNDFKPGICSLKSPEIQSEHLTKQTGKVQWRHLSASQYQTPQPSRDFLIPIPSFVPKTQKKKLFYSSYSTFWQGFPGEYCQTDCFSQLLVKLSMLWGGICYVFKWCIAAVNKH